jgi:hypothetical protein
MPTGLKAWLSQKLLGEEPPPAPPRPRAASQPFHAVGIVPGDPSCEAAKQMGRMRFLSAKAPPLPLPDCHAAVCTCRYAHYSDRRSGQDRRASYDWTRERQIDAVNRRQSHGRRRTDARA